MGMMPFIRRREATKEAARRAEAIKAEAPAPSVESSSDVEPPSDAPKSGKRRAG